MSNHGALCGCGCPGVAGLGAVWTYPTSYMPEAHRRYMPGMGEVQIGSTGWTVGDAASLALIVLAVIAIRKEWT